MRINQFLAQATGMSRRAADKAVSQGRVKVNQTVAVLGTIVTDSDQVTLDGVVITPSVNTITIMLNKPVGYVCSRDGQGSKTIYDLLPVKYHHLKPVGRLDKDSSGLLLLTNDGTLAHQLTHPSFQKEKLYEVELDKPLTKEDQHTIENGLKIDDYLSRLRLSKLENWEMKNENCSWQVAMSMGRNRQIRRTLGALGYKVTKLHRTKFGQYQLHISDGKFEIVQTKDELNA